MRDAFGGIVNITTIVVFLVIVSGYLAFNVSYTKAFRIKNKIITAIEQYEGNCESGSACEDIITNEIRQLGYHPKVFNDYEVPGCTTKHAPTDKGSYYIGKCPANEAADDSEKDNIKYYYRVETAIDISIPIINDILANIPDLRLKGNTKLITEK